jgi:hypothetical protein
MEWNLSLTNTISTELKGESTTHLQTILIWALTNCHDTSKPIPITDGMNRFSQLIQEQTTIGWDQIVKGRWSTEWVRHLEIAFPSKGEQYATNILVSIWKAILKIWNTRCNKQHSHQDLNTVHQKQDLIQQVLAGKMVSISFYNSSHSCLNKQSTSVFGRSW